MQNLNILFDVDSYKVSHWKQYPPKTENIYSYIESRGGVYHETLFLGAQAFARSILKNPVTLDDIEKANDFWTKHGVPFNKEGWEYIVKKHDGFLPLLIKILPEGGVYKTGTPLVTVVNTDPACYWLTSWVETSLLRYVWYMTSVGTVSFNIKKVLKKYLDKSGDPSSIYFKLHDFGLRGVSSRESGMLGGMSHLVNFKGSDNAISAYAAKELYDADLNNVAFSIPAAEHSSITSWGKGNEVLAYKNMVTQFSKPGSIYAVVSDSYDIFNAVENIWGKQLASYVKEKEGTLVIRPDSGDPVVVIPKLLTSLYKHFGGYKNEKGYVVLNNVRLIWGDGIEKITIQSILSVIVDMMGFSVDNIAFGMGGGLLQHVNRDTQKFAMKCSAAKIDGTWVDVFKDPITDKGKTSKKGLFDESSMRILYNNGKIYSESFDDICKKSETYL